MSAPEPVVVMPIPAETPCGCRHTAEAHEHYRSGTDCSRCDCSAFRPAARRNRIWARRPRRRDGLTALMDAVAREKRRGPCGCLACEINFDEDEVTTDGTTRD